MYYVPTLDISGWAKTPETVVNELLSNYTKTNPLQTLTFAKSIYSLQSAIFKCGGDMRLLTPEVNSGLGKIFNNYFPEGAEVNSSVENLDEDSGRFNLKIEVSVIHNGKTYDGGALISRLSKTYLDTDQMELIYI